MNLKEVRDIHLAVAKEHVPAPVMDIAEAMIAYIDSLGVSLDGQLQNAEPSPETLGKIMLQNRLGDILTKMLGVVDDLTVFHQAAKHYSFEPLEDLVSQMEKIKAEVEEEVANAD